MSLVDDITKYPTMPQYSDMPTMPVWLEQGVEVQEDDGSDGDDDADDVDMED